MVQSFRLSMSGRIKDNDDILRPMGLYGFHVLTVIVKRKGEKT